MTGLPRDRTRPSFEVKAPGAPHPPQDPRRPGRSPSHRGAVPAVRRASSSRTAVGRGDPLAVGVAGLLALGEGAELPGSTRGVAVERLGRDPRPVPRRRTGPPRRSLAAQQACYAYQLQAGSSVRTAARRCGLSRVRCLVRGALTRPRALQVFSIVSSSSRSAPPATRRWAELAEDGEVESGVGQLQAEGILPVDPAADGVGRLGGRRGPRRTA